MKKILFIFVFMVFLVVLNACGNDTADLNENESDSFAPLELEEHETQNIIDYVKYYYLNHHLISIYSPDIESVYIVSFDGDGYDSIRIDGTIPLSALRMSIASGIDSTWLEYITHNQGILVQITYSYLLTEEQWGALWGSGTYKEYAIVIKNENGDFEIIDNTSPQDIIN